MTYKIAVRSYDRPKMFAEHTYAMLSRQKNIDLGEQLYIFVASDEQKAMYEESLKDKPYKEMIVGEKGAAIISRYMARHFKPGENVFFFDDDHTKFIEWRCEPTTDKSLFFKDSDNLDVYLKDGFVEIEKNNVGCFTFAGISNSLFLKGKPFKTFNITNLYGAAFGLKIDPYMVETEFSQNDDVERGAKLMEKFGGILRYHWCGFPADNYGKFEGGMQSSGDRGGEGDKKTIAETQAKKLLERFPFTSKYFKIEYNKVRDWYDFKVLKRNETKRYGNREIVWKDYFGEAVESNSSRSTLESAFN